VHLDPLRIREQLERARLLLLFSPEVCKRHDPLVALEAALPFVDVVQVRPKSLDASGLAPCAARDTFDWCLRVLERIESRSTHDVLVTVDDRVDVARALWSRGCAGVHVGQDDCPAGVAREFLGPEPLIGLSTHSLVEVAAAEDERVDYVGFGPFQPTRTKGYERGLGPEACWIASAASPRPLFPIGGIDRTNVIEIARIGRAAVASAILDADDPARAARELRDLLAAGDD
jgi:thiamine-phosphate pyrophosphorylase